MPYRDREEHLKQFIPHIKFYFSRDKLDKNISYSVHIIEQLGTKDFNRGKLKNCGFDIAKDVADYFCFHDVDYLPIWADYSFCDRPTHLIWHGLPKMDQRNDFFGAVCMLKKSDFERINGFSNEYWGWGYEDDELRLRCKTQGIAIERRDGTYQPLPHENAGFDEDNKHTLEAAKNKKLILKRVDKLKSLMVEDGLSSLEYNLKETTEIKTQSDLPTNIFTHKVEI